MATRQPECGICMNSIKGPKVLSCHHSFCYTCLEDYLRVNLRNGRFDCPICRTNVELPSECVPGFEANVYNTEYAEKGSHDISHSARGVGGQGRTISPVKHSSPLMKEDIELHHAKEPWKPKCLVARIDDGEVDIRSDDLYKKVRGILNKLTPQTFQKLVAKMQSLNIDTETCLRNVIDMVFETAICDPRFSTAYANMCRCLSMFKVPAESKQGDVNFRALLLTRCQQEFEKANSSEKEFDSKRKEIDKATTEEQKQQMKEELEAEETKAKRRSLGNIRFIGELFKLKMLTENIMHDCVFKLLRTKDEENLECLCRLLRTIGKELDTDKAKLRMDQYFEQMQKIVNEKKLSSRVRFMLQDVIELRQPTETEASAPVVEKENEEPTESAIIQDKVIASEMTPPPPIVNEEVVDTVEINIENVDSSDVSVAVENEKNEKLKLKYKYKEDQWSPINHEGKKQYDRDFLLQLQNAPESTLKPLDLPDIPEIIIEKPQTRSANRGFAEGSSFVDFTPRYVWSGGPNRSGGVPRRASGQRGRGGPGGSATQAKHINLSIQKDIELHHAKEACIPGQRVEKMDGEVDLKSEELFKKVRVILNELTPQKFQTLVAKMQALEIDTEARLKSVIDLVFEKAISEPGFSVAYANMCRCLFMFKVPAESKQGDVNFRALLLTRCQREFEKANSSKKEFDSKRKEIKRATAEDQKQQMKEELEAEETKAKRRSLGNIRFIGELFKLKMLRKNIMHDCVFKLLRSRDEENLECLCILLKTIGKELDIDKAKLRMDQYFEQMQKIVNEKKLSSRVRFMLQDVIELRQPTETEASAPVVEKENEEPTESAIIQDKVIASEMTPPPPIVNEEVVDTVEINIENVDSSDVSVAVENEKNEKLKLKYKYKEDQWSPINHEGKKQYDRDFLLQLQNAPESTLKPLDLPDIPEIIIEKPQTRSANRGFAEGSSFVDFTPRYVWSGGPNRSGGVPRRASGQRGRGGPGGSATQAKHINLSIQKDIELHHAKEACIPGQRVEKMDGEVDLKSEELFKKVRVILNELTPQKFQTLVAKMQALEIDTEARLKSVIDLVFEKAISEPGFSVAYANMCRCLFMFKVPAESKQGDVNFRALLLTRCQREFEKANSSKKEFDSKRKEIKRATAEDQKQQMKEELEAEETKAKRRSLGNIRFIGELFKLKMLRKNIMHDCVFKLLRSRDEENLECLCILLKTIGKELDIDKAKLRMDQYFEQMQKIVNEKKLSSRVRFMLQDVIELRQPTETEASAPVVEKENEEPTESAIIQDKVIASEMTPPPPIVNEEVVDTVEINIENVDSSDVSVAVENEKNEKLKLKYKYKEDQWSPINHEGKKQYDRDFLLQLQNAPESTLKPLDLPDIPEIIIEKPQTRSANRGFAEGSSFVDFTPRYVWSGGPNRSGGVPRRASGQRGRGGPGGSATQAKHINLSIQKDIELHHAKEACIPGQRVEKMDGEVDLKSEELFKKVRVILNELTPQKFQTLVAKMQALEIDTEARLKSVIDLVFEKAISEPGFSVAYANMCRCLFMFKVPAESKQGDVNFRALLLTRCQREFEKANSSKKEFDSKRKEIKRATAEDQKQQMKEELEAEETKAKRRSLGNIRFIGELFKLKMLRKNIMHDCVFKLLRSRDEENLECLCILLKTIGKELDIDKAKLRMDQYFEQMQKIVNEKKLSSRVRFMLQDVIELRQPTETEASAPVVEKENEEPTESAIIQDKVIASEMTPPPPIVNEEVVDTVEINIENVDSSDVSVAVENEKNEKLKLKYKYKEDQWSPINHEGKKQYDRDFLLQLQNAPESTLKPLDLPDIPEIIIEKPQTRSANRGFAEGSSFVDFTPRYVWSGGPNRSGGVPRRASGQRGRGGPGGSATQAKHINLSIQKDIELHHAKEACIPGQRVEKMDGEVDLKSEELFKKVRVILNELTPQKFQTLVAKMQALEIDTEARLKSVIDLVFEKAISEPGFSVAYANMCRCLFMFKVPAESKQGDVNFRALLLTRCQREFEKANSSKKEFDSKRKEIKRATAEDQKQQMKEELEAEETKAKRRSLGNIRFIGELFKLKMLRKNIMHDCVFKLLRSRDEENLECLCILLKTIGKELDIDKAKLRMDQYFEQMQKIVNEKKLSSRVRFMLQDVIELRQPTETEASAPVVEKENEEPTESAIIQDKVIASEMTPPPPIVNEEVVDTVEINIENVDSSDVSVAVENEKNEKLKLKYKYKEDQWSPINHEGKKQYDRDFLLQLQNAPESTLKPLDLPDIPEIIIEKPQTRSANRGFAEGSSFVDFTPRYVWSGGPNRSGGVPRRASGQRGRGGPGGSATQAKHINLSIQKDIELHHAKEACIPGQRVEKMDGEVDLKSEELFKKVRVILNELTPQKFQTLVAKMQALEIDTEARLKSVIDLVFEKAISEPGFSVAYANMCRCLFMFKVPAESKQGDVNFRALLLTRCQREFEKANSSKKEFDSKRKEIKRATAEDQKQQMKEELEAEETKAKRRSLGNIRFIGELFKLKMLRKNIMHDCVFKLLRSRDEENLECLCILLKTIGKELDIDKAKLRMDQYFEQMQKIVNEKKLSSRVRFMLQDVIELRQPTETEASAPVVEKENEEPTESAIIQDKVIASEMTPPPPIVNEEVVDTVEINIENVDSSDVSVAVENEKNEKLKLKYKYKEDQWSPINHEGKKQYDRDFLLQLQNAPESTLKPLDLPDIPEIIIEKPQTRSANRGFAEGSSFVDFTPRYVWSGGPNRSGGVPRRASGQRGRGGPGGSATQAKHINLSIQKDIELHHAKEACIPGQRVEKMDGEVDLKSEELFKKVRVILNELTPQKFQTLVAKMQALEIDTEARLKSVIDLVFEKAISEPGFSVAYANMCRCLFMFKVPAESKQGDVNFRALLLTRCQREFEKANSSKKEFDSKRKEIKRATAEDQKQQMKEELEAEETKAKRRSLGNIRFIGELFKLKMLRKNIMHDCVFKLLRSRDEENLECLCILLKTIGKELDIDKAKLRMDQYFEQMQKIVNEKKLSSRVRFMLQDVIELRQPTETEASAPVVEKENEEPTESAIIQDKVIASEMTPPPPIVNEEVVDTVEINIENVDSSDVSVAVENEKNEKLKLKYKYKEDQWSPINHEGKKQYDRDFLLQLQNAPESTLKPLDLPDIPEIIIEKPQTRSANRGFAEGSSFVDFTPRYVWSGGPNRSGGVPRRASGQRGRGGPGGSATQAKHINLSIQKDIELHHAKEACIPGQRVEKMDGEVDLKSEELFKKVRVILNELTPQKFQTLVAKMQALEIDTEARLKSVIDLVFEKAISEPGFSVAYANMCRCLFMFKVPAESKQGDVNFRALLLTRCQREFEKANSSKKEFDSKRKEIKRATAEDQKQQMKEELEAEETKAKRRSLGNIRFIGELFKLKMLRKNIMHDCVFKLLRSRDEENLECLCILLKTIGKELDIDKAKPRMDQYFVQMQKIVNEKKLSSRVRFMLQDVIELRQGKWVPRGDDNNPKTIDQIHRDVAQEAQDRAIFLQTLPQAKPQKGSHGRPGQTSGPMGGGADGWNTVSRAPIRTDRTIDPTKLKLSKFQLGDSENIQLGPGGGAARLGWFKGSAGGGARFQEGERPNAPGIRTIVAQRPSEERSGGREPERAKTMEKPSTPVQELTGDQILNKTHAIMDEYLHIQDVEVAISCVQELSSSGSLHLFVYNALNQVLERSEVSRRQTGLLMHDLVKNNVLLVDTYVKGLNEILMFAEDMEIDIPKIWEYLGQLIGPMVQDGSVPLGFLKQVCEPLKANGKSGILVAEILHDASHREGHKKVGKLWAESRLHWSDFDPKNQIDQFLSEKKLEFTKGGNSATTSSTASMAIPKIEERLNDLITNKGCSNEEVFDWIEEEVDELTVKQEYFIHALMTAVCKSAVIVSSNNLMKVDKSRIQKRNNLLQKYLDHQANFELQALFALQALVHKLEHPPGVLRELFDILYDEDIISEDAFIQWEKSEDPQEQEGKGVAMKQDVHFFT